MSVSASSSTEWDLTNIPIEVISNIFSFSNIKDLIAISKVCTVWRYVAFTKTEYGKIYPVLQQAYLQLHRILSSEKVMVPRCIRWPQIHFFLVQPEIKYDQMEVYTFETSIERSQRLRGDIVKLQNTVEQQMQQLTKTQLTVTYKRDRFTIRETQPPEQIPRFQALITQFFICFCPKGT